MRCSFIRLKTLIVYTNHFHGDVSIHNNYRYLRIRFRRELQYSIQQKNIKNAIDTTVITTPIINSRTASKKQNNMYAYTELVSMVRPWVHHF